MVNLRDALGFDEVNQEYTSTTVISGTNVYATTAVTTPLISATNLNGTNISGTNFYQTSKGLLQSVSIGSGTAVYGAKIQAGSGVLSSSVGWKVYPVAFTGIPTVNATDRTDGAVCVGSIGAGSFWISGTGASDAYSWSAIGI